MRRYLLNGESRLDEEPVSVHFGAVGAPPPDWRKVVDFDPDDEEIDTPKDIIELLGFDPVDEGGEELEGVNDVETP